jgi:hypothetical protein
MKVRILKLAKQDIKDAYWFYESRSQGLGKRFRKSMQDDIGQLASVAGIHASDYGCQRMLATKFPFAIFYRVNGPTATVIAILDMRRDPKLGDR